MQIHQSYDFEKGIQTNLNVAIEGGKKLFKVRIETGYSDITLFDILLENIPAEFRQHYNCNACRHFVNRYGNLVVMDEFGNIQSAVWNLDTTPKFFVKAVTAVINKVLSSKVMGVFIAESRELGYRTTGKWSHLAANVPSAYVASGSETANQQVAKKLEEFRTLTNALLEYTPETVEQTVNLIESGTLYRGDRVAGNAKWFKELQDKRNSVSNSNNKNNITWLYVAEAPTGFCSIRSSALGTLLDDIQSGMNMTIVSNRFTEKMKGYMRSTVAPSEGNKEHAERLIVDLGYAESLRRRYARLDEVLPHALWTPKTKNSTPSTLGNGGLFGNVKTKSTVKDSTTNPSNVIPSSVMTWDKFQRTVLPTAESIEVLVDNPGRIMALVTAAIEEAKVMFQWPNPFSWYYHLGVDGDIEKRVEYFGGQHKGNEIRCSLMWDGYTDLDLHCETPNGEHIYWNQKRANRCNGYLDLDMNGLDKRSDNPVENLRWSKNAPEGIYKIYVNNYSERTNRAIGTPFVLELEVNGVIYRHEGKPLRNKCKVTVFEFEYRKGQQPTFLGSTPISTGGSSWNVEMNEFIKVTAITNSPNKWDGNESDRNGHHIFFLLDGLKDTSEGLGRGFFNEMLVSELHPIRKTLEGFTALTPIEGIEESNANGVGFSKDSDWNLTVRVKSNNSTRVIKIDRFD